MVTSQLLSNWTRWIDVFEQAVADQQCDGLAAYLAADVQYHVTGCPFACSVLGRSAVINGFAQSIANFDAKFDARHWTATNTHLGEPNVVTTTVWGHYQMAGKPDLRFPAMGQWIFDADGKLIAMIDSYDLGSLELQQAFAWLEQHGEGLDPSYL